MKCDYTTNFTAYGFENFTMTSPIILKRVNKYK